MQSWSLLINLTLQKKTPSEPAKSVAPAAAPVTAAAPVVANDEPVVAAITGAIVAMGYSSDQIASIRPATPAVTGH